MHSVQGEQWTCKAFSTCVVTLAPCHAKNTQVNILVDTMQVTVVFLVDVDKCLPDQKQWPEVWAKQQAWKQAKKDHEDSLVSFSEILLGFGKHCQHAYLADALMLVVRG